MSLEDKKPRLKKPQEAEKELTSNPILIDEKTFVAWEKAYLNTEEKEKLRETIDKATKRLAEIDKELAELPEEVQVKESDIEQLKTKTFSSDEINKIGLRILTTDKRVKAVRWFKFFAQSRNTLSLETTVVINQLGVKEISSVFRNDGNGINLDMEYMVHPGETDVNLLLMSSMGEKIKEYIENKENKKVEKIEIVNGARLKVTFGSTPDPLSSNQETLQKTEEKHATANLKRIIENGQKIIMEETEGEAAKKRKKRIAELSAELETEEKVKVLEKVSKLLPEDVRNLIEDEKKKIIELIKRYRHQQNPEMLETVQFELQLLESDPVKFFTKKMEDCKGINKWKDNANLNEQIKILERIIKELEATNDNQ